MGKSKIWHAYTCYSHGKRVELPTGDVMPPIHLSQHLKVLNRENLSIFMVEVQSTREHFERTMASLEGVENYEEMHSFAMASAAAVTLIGELAKPEIMLSLQKMFMAAQLNFSQQLQQKEV